MTDSAVRRATSPCRICGGGVRVCLDFGRQPVSQAFVRPGSTGVEHFFRLAVGICDDCSMVQQVEEVDRERMFHADYPYRASGSSFVRDHFARTARYYLETELAGRDDPFVVEIGSNDGVMLETVSGQGVRHLGVDPSRGAAEAAAAKGVRVHVAFFEEASAAAVRASDGPADLIFSANTTSHIAALGSVFRGVETLLSDTGVFVFEDRYLGDIVEHTYFDQVYDEHFYLFSAHSVRNLAARFGLELVDAQRLPMHGGSVRYTVARPGVRSPSAALEELVAQERKAGLDGPEPLLRFAAAAERTRTDLTELLYRLRAQGRTVAAYGATAKSATVNNYCGIGPDLVSYVCDSTPEKHWLLTPGTHIPVVPSETFAEPYPDYALLFAWNHAEEIMAKERRFTEQGGRWILYVPDVHIV
ncbi:methyltransferase domain-containing protein [Streptomyces sp. NPDC051567]|uniref:methyltransferase domain-containing protein n=1 Tax=Streptomyces sp. NPDC051567 TaxID=3365660 RepID=UPI0037AD208C